MPPDSTRRFEDRSASQQHFLSLFLRSEREIFRYVAALVPNVTDAEDCPIHITELDINSAAGAQRGFGADISANASATQGGLVIDADKKLANAYAGEHRDSVKMATFWGANDANSWRANGKPLWFDGECKTKPAFDGVIAERTKATAK